MTDSLINSQDATEELSLMSLFQIIADNFRLLVITPLVVGLIVLVYSFFIPPTFSSTTTILPPQQQQSSANVLLQNLGSLGGLAGAATGLKNPIDQYISFIKSIYIKDRLIERFKLKERYKLESHEDARKILESNTRVATGKDGLISIEGNDKDPIFAATLANAYVDELTKLLQKLALTEAQQRRVFFESQLLGAKDKLVKADLALRASGVNRSALKSNPQAAIATVARLQAEIAAQEIKISSMRAYLAENAPLFRQAVNDLNAFRAQLNKVESNTEAPTSSDGDYVAKFRDVKYYETLFELFSKQYELAKIDEAREGVMIQILDIAKPAERKSKPNKALLAIQATLITGFMLLVLIFMRVGYANLSNSKDGALLKSTLLKAITGKDKYEYK